MPLTVTKAGQAPVLMSVGAALDLLQRGSPSYEALFRGIKAGENVPVVFRDGTAGTVGPLNPQPERDGEPPEEEPSSQLPAQRLTTFTLDCRLLIAVDACISAQGYTLESVMDALRAGTIEGLISHIEVDRSRFAEVYGELDRAFAAGDMPALFEHVHDIVDIVELEDDNVQPTLPYMADTDHPIAWREV